MLSHWEIFPLRRPDYLIESIAFKRLFQISCETGVKGTYRKFPDFTNMSSVTISCNWIFHHVVCVYIVKAKDNIKGPYFLPLLGTTVKISCFCYILETLNTWRKKMLFVYKFKKLSTSLHLEGGKKNFHKMLLKYQVEGGGDLGGLLFFFFKLYLLQIFFSHAKNQNEKRLYWYEENLILTSPNIKESCLLFPYHEKEFCQVG